MTMGIPIKAITSITVSVRGVEDALYMVRLNSGFKAGTIFGKMVAPTTAIIEKMINDEDKNPLNRCSLFRKMGNEIRDVSKISRIR